MQARPLHDFHHVGEKLLILKRSGADPVPRIVGGQKVLVVSVFHSRFVISLTVY